MTPRELVVDLFHAALAQAHGGTLTARWLADHPLPGPVWSVAVGKAAAAMAQGAVQALDGELGRGLLVTKHGYLPAGGCTPFAAREAGHPVPDADSLAAGAELLRFVGEAPASVHWLFLISGGTSSLVEALPGGQGLADLQRAQRWLLGSGLDIAAVNRVRKALSLIKGGRLAARLAGGGATVLLLSDVAGDDPAVIGSGPLFPDPGGPPERLAIPDWLARQVRAAPPAPAPGDPVFAGIAHVVVGSLADACRGAADRGRELGLTVHRGPDRLAGDAAAAGERLARTLRDGPDGLWVWGGETTVRLPERPGTGGRAQHLALAAARVLEGRDDLCLLSAGTDGTDGPTPAAGAVVDAGTLARGRGAGLDPAACLARADSGRFLTASGDLLTTGPTGTNVNDLVIALKGPVPAVGSAPSRAAH